MTLAPELHALDFLILFWKIPRYISSSCDKWMMCSSSCSGKNDFGRVISRFWMVLLAQVSHFSVEDTKSQSKYSVDPIQDNTFLLAVSNQSILKEINPEYSLEELLLKLKLQYFGHLLQRDDSLKNTLMLGKTEGKRRRGWQRMRWLDSITDSMDMNSSNSGRQWDREAWYAAVHGAAKNWTWLSSD